VAVGVDDQHVVEIVHDFSSAFSSAFAKVRRLRSTTAKVSRATETLPRVAQDVAHLVTVF
jgi:hypothetical protein